MKIEFEEWLNEQNFETEVNNLFKESIICYKASAYRAAHLFSFLGFQTIIKQRIIYSKQPAKNYAEGEWDSLIKSVSNDDKRDKVIIDAIQNKKKPIFNISEDLREQYGYWKDRRNDCAHAKGNMISYPHVEGYWLFIQSNLGKFVVNGGMEMMLQEITNYFNPVLTPTGTSIGPIVKEIPSAIDLIDFNDFLNELKKFTLEQSKTGYKMFEENISHMWYKLFDLPANYLEIIVFFLEEDPEFCLKLIRRYPKMLQYFNRNESFNRRLWKEDFLTSNDYKIFVNLLNYNSIPESQHDEAFDHVLNNLNTIYFEEDDSRVEVEEKINAFDQSILKRNNFFDKFNELAFEEEYIGYDFNWGNRNKELVIYYIKNFGVNKTVVEAINKALNKQYPPFKLRKELEYFYKEDPLKLEIYMEISEDVPTDAPEVLCDLYELQTE